MRAGANVEGNLPDSHAGRSGRSLGAGAQADQREKALGQDVAKKCDVCAWRVFCAARASARVVEIGHMLRLSQILAMAPHSDQRERSTEETLGAAR